MVPQASNASHTTKSPVSFVPRGEPRCCWKAGLLEFAHGHPGAALCAIGCLSFERLSVLLQQEQCVCAQLSSVGEDGGGLGAGARLKRQSSVQCRQLRASETTGGPRLIEHIVETTGGDCSAVFSGASQLLVDLHVDALNHIHSRALGSERGAALGVGGRRERPQEPGED